MVRTILALVAAAVLGAAVGVTGDRLLSEPGLGPEVTGSGTLELLPPAPVRVVAETVRLGQGFSSRHLHGGPTFNLVRSGVVRIEEPGGPRRYGAGELFFEPAERTHTIVVLEAARLDVLRLLPEGAAPTTDVEGP
ncbi:MAG: hypothetical protein H0X21_01740 [Actinobacteria bacterium]|nr:hypothetical protein [Actinomycetota bacterium]